nr:MAG TPA: TetR family Transcriptional regulator [Bacteriophage sp.]
MITAFDSGKLNKTLEKVWGALTFLNDKTDGGFFKLRQAADTALLKRSSFYKYVNGQKVEDGWMS